MRDLRTLQTRNLPRGSHAPTLDEASEFAVAYDALADEYTTFGELLRARQHAGTTQAQVAERMGIAQASVVRLESSAGSRKHAPSIATLRCYTGALDRDLRLSLVPKCTRSRSARHGRA